MDRSFADELYSEVSRPNSELGRVSVPGSKESDSHDESWFEDDSSRNDTVEELGNVSDLDRDWQRRRNQFHTVGYREGLMAGKEASAQEGFNVGFNESVHAGFKWGVVRGVTSALACLPDGLIERMIETEEERNKFGQLYESVRSLSTTDALQLFHDDLRNKTVKKTDIAENSSATLESRDQSSDRNKFGQLYESVRSLSTTDALQSFHDDLPNETVKKMDIAGNSSATLESHDQSSDRNLLDRYHGELKSLISESSAIKARFGEDQKKV